MGNDQAQMLRGMMPATQPQMSAAEQAKLRAAQYLATITPPQPGVQALPPQALPPQALPPQALPPLPPPPMVMVPMPPMPQTASQPLPSPQQVAMAQAAQMMQQYTPAGPQAVPQYASQPMNYGPQPSVGPPAPVFQPMPAPSLPPQGGQKIAESLRSPVTYDPNQEPITSGDAYSGDYSLPAAYYKFGRYVDGNGEDVDPAATGYRFYNRAGTASYTRPFLPTVRGKYAQNNATQNLATNNPK